MAALAECFFGDCVVCGTVHQSDVEHQFKYISEHIDPELIDPISLLPLFDGVCFPNSECPHSFSRVSLIRCLQTKQECPLCKKHITMADSKPVLLILRNMLDKLKVQCPNEPSCEFGPLCRGDLPHHLTTCPTSIVTCPNKFREEACSRKFLRRDFADHQTSCELRLISCANGCGSTMCFRDSSQHNCVNFLSGQLSSAWQEIAFLRQALATSEKEREESRHVIASLITELEQTRAPGSMPTLPSLSSPRGLRSRPGTAGAGAARLALSPASASHLTLLKTLTGHTKRINSCAFAPDGRTLVTSSFIGEYATVIWSTETWAQLRRLSPAYTCSVAPDGRTLVSSSHRDAIVWDTATGTRIKVLSGHYGTVWAACYSPDGMLVLTGSQNKTARLWDVATGLQLRTFTGHNDRVEDCCFSPDGSQVLTAAGDDTAILWDAASGALARRLCGHSGTVYACAYSPDGSMVVTASADKTVRLWLAETGALVRVLSGHSDRVSDCCFSPDGSLVLTASADRTAMLWSVSTGELVHRLVFEEGVTVCCFDPFGAAVALGLSSGVVHVWGIVS